MCMFLCTKPHSIFLSDLIFRISKYHFFRHIFFIFSRGWCRSSISIGFCSPTIFLASLSLGFGISPARIIAFKGILDTSLAWSLNVAPLTSFSTMDYSLILRIPQARFT
jgi:hypothetical protein